MDFFLQVWIKLLQLCPTPGDPKDYSLPGSSVHGILQARILEWVAISFSRGTHTFNLVFINGFQGESKLPKVI